MNNLWGKVTMFSGFRTATVGAAALSLAATFSPSAQAGYVVTLHEVGNVVATGSLGVAPGTYVWSWVPGENQNFTLQIGPAAAAPEPASLTLLGRK